MDNFVSVYVNMYVCVNLVVLLNRGYENTSLMAVLPQFGEEGGTSFIVNVQAHGIDDQEEVNPSSRINDGDLVEGGQLLILNLGGTKGKKSKRTKGTTGSVGGMSTKGGKKRN